MRPLVFATGVHTGSDTLGFLAGAGAGAGMAALFGLLAIYLNTNQYATGLALSLFGAGLSAFCGLALHAAEIGRAGAFRPAISERSAICRAFFQHHPLVYGALLLTLGLSWFLYRSQAGLVLRAVGEAPESAHVWAIRFGAFGWLRSWRAGRCVWSGGVSVVWFTYFVEGMVAGKGWIALALTTFATWRPARVLLGSLLFGGVTML